MFLVDLGRFSNFWNFSWTSVRTTWGWFKRTSLPRWPFIGFCLISPGVILSRLSNTTSIIFELHHHPPHPHPHHDHPFQVKYLEKADLSSNEISFIEEGAFRNLAHMKTLDLSNNKWVFPSFWCFFRSWKERKRDVCLFYVFWNWLDWYDHASAVQTGVDLNGHICGTLSPWKVFEFIFYFEHQSLPLLLTFNKFLFIFVAMLLLLSFIFGRLKLSSNVITTLEFGAFNHLINIQKVL